MLIKPFHDLIASTGYFKSIEFSKNIPEGKELERIGKLPALFLLPVRSKGSPPSSDARPKQRVEHEYGIVIVTEHNFREIEIEEPAITFARKEVTQALLGACLDSSYSGLSLKDSGLHDVGSGRILWSEVWTTQSTNRI